MKSTCAAMKSVSRLLWAMPPVSRIASALPLRAMAIALKGKADAILLTGGIAHNKRLTDFIAAHVDFIAPVFVYPGENELEALARNALAVLRGDCEAKTYYKADVTA